MDPNGRRTHLGVLYGFDRKSGDADRSVSGRPSKISLTHCFSIFMKEQRSATKLMEDVQKTHIGKIFRLVWVKSWYRHRF